jgi:hypothetical protein
MRLSIETDFKSPVLSGIIFNLIFYFLITGTYSYAQQVDQLNVTGLNWEIETLHNGINWWSYRGDDLFGARLSINMIEVETDIAGIDYEIAYVQNELMRTSILAAEKNALAAINGSFFNIDAGGSVVFMKVHGEVVTDGAIGGSPYTENGGIGWSNNGNPKIYEKPASGWHGLDIMNLLSSGPLLVLDGVKREFNNDPFNQNRHPRTAVATTDDGRLFLVTVDGRSFQSYGMTIPELADFFIGLGTDRALNLDGGGSTVMYIRNKNTDGIVSHPSDNLEFDHEGERGVSNAFLLIDK